MTPAAVSARSQCWVLAALGAVYLVLQYLLCRKLVASSAAGAVTEFLLLFAAQGLVYGAALCWSSRYGHSAEAGRTSWRRDPVLGVVLVVAILTRMLGMTAGLDSTNPGRGLGRELASFTASALDEPSGYEPFLLYDNDVWRYLWDGAVVARGGSPWRTSPAQIDGTSSEPTLSSRGTVEPSWLAAFERDILERDRYTDVISRLSYPTVHSVYGPVAQALFAAAFWLAPGSVLLWKLLVATAEGAVLVLLAALYSRWRREQTAPASQSTPHLTLPSLTWVLLAWSWNPLVLKELSASAHLDVFLVALQLISVWLASLRSAGALVPLALAIAIKPTAVLLLPLLALFVPRRAWFWGGLATGAIWLPLWTSLPHYLEASRVLASEWRFNAGLWELLRRGAAAFTNANAAGSVANAAYAAALVVLSLLAFCWVQRHRTLGDLVLWSGVLTCAMVWLGPVVNPWYLIWSLPFFALCGPRAWPGSSLTLVVSLSYLHYIDQQTPGWALVSQHALFVAAALLFATWLWRVREDREGTATKKGSAAPTALP